MLIALIKGFSISAGFIIAIGAQNAFVIRQGLLRQHLLLTALLCSVIDAVLIILGVLGFGKILSSYPFFIVSAKYFAIAFLGFYGALALRSAFKKHSLSSEQEKSFVSMKTTLLTLLGFSLLNPHVYLDTVILLGSIASQQPLQDQPYFAIGAIAASFMWFFSLTYGSRFLAPLLQRPKSWQILDAAIALTMWSLACTLFQSL